MTDTQKWLADYVRDGSESAFRQLVAAYLDLVYSTAVRLMNGDRHLAEDVAQKVFVDLATTARTLSRDAALGGWLHRHTCFVAANALRGERRRQSRERQAAEMSALQDHSQIRLSELAPVLDEAVNQLGPEDRTAILLRFYGCQDFRAIGQALGTTEDAVQKRVSRALEKLHTLLTQRGVTLTVSALGIALAGEAVTAAPVGLSTNIAAASLAAAGTQALTLLKILTMTKVKITLAAVAVAVVAVPMTMQYQALAKLRQKNQALRLQADRLAQLRAENERLSNNVIQSAKERENQLDELAKLRGEVVGLRTEKKNAELRAQLLESMLRTNPPGSTVVAEPSARFQKNFGITRRITENLRQAQGADPDMPLQELLLAYFKQSNLELEAPSSVEFKPLTQSSNSEIVGTVWTRATLQELAKIESLISKLNPPQQ